MVRKYDKNGEIGLAFVSDGDAEILRCLGYERCEDRGYTDNLGEFVEVWKPVPKNEVVETSLSEEMQTILKQIGCAEPNFPHIERALEVTEYVYFPDFPKCKKPKEKISQEIAIEKLGLETFVRGIFWSAYNYSSLKKCIGDGSIGFNSVALLKIER